MLTITTSVAFEFNSAGGLAVGTQNKNECVLPARHLGCGFPLGLSSHPVRTFPLVFTPVIPRLLHTGADAGGILPADWALIFHRSDTSRRTTDTPSVVGGLLKSGNPPCSTPKYQRVFRGKTLCAFRFPTFALFTAAGRVRYESGR